MFTALWVVLLAIMWPMVTYADEAEQNTEQPRETEESDAKWIPELGIQMNAGLAPVITDLLDQMTQVRLRTDAGLSMVIRRYEGNYFQLGLVTEFALSTRWGRFIGPAGSPISFSLKYLEVPIFWVGRAQSILSARMTPCSYALGSIMTATRTGWPGR